MRHPPLASVFPSASTALNLGTDTFSAFAPDSVSLIATDWAKRRLVHTIPAAAPSLTAAHQGTVNLDELVFSIQ